MKHYGPPKIMPCAFNKWRIIVDDRFIISFSQTLQYKFHEFPINSWGRFVSSSTELRTVWCTHAGLYS